MSSCHLFRTCSACVKATPISLLFHFQDLHSSHPEEFSFHHLWAVSGAVLGIFHTALSLYYHYWQDPMYQLHQTMTRSWDYMGKDPFVWKHLLHYSNLLQVNLTFLLVRSFASLFWNSHWSMELLQHCIHVVPQSNFLWSLNGIICSHLHHLVETKCSCGWQGRKCKHDSSGDIKVQEHSSDLHGHQERV